MPLKYCKLQIDDCREMTGETDYSSTNGTPQSVALEGLNEGQIHCQNLIYKKYPELFEIETEQLVVGGQSVYEIPENSFLGGSVQCVFFSPTGLDSDYYELNSRTPRFRSHQSDLPTRWVSSGVSAIRIDPVPTTSEGKIKIIHGAHLDTLDLRRGTIDTAPVLDGPLENYISITLRSDSNLDETTLAANEFICVSNASGEVTYYNIPYDYVTGYNETTKVLIFLTPQSVTLGSISALSFITCGKYTATHSKLDKCCEPLMKAYCKRNLYLTKSSTDAQNQEDTVTLFEKDILFNYSRMTRGPKKFPYQGKYE